MSNRLIDLALEAETQTLTQKIVLVYLANAANDKSGGTCFPSIETICRISGASRRSVFRAIDTLEKAGHIQRISGRAKKRTNTYRVHPKPRVKGATMTPLDDDFDGNEGCNHDTPEVQPWHSKGATTALQGCNHDTQNRKETKDKPNLTQPPAPIESANASSHFAQGEEDDETLAILKRLGRPSAPTTTPPPEPKEDEQEENEELPLPNVSSEKKKKTGAQKEKVWEPDEYQKVINGWFDRRDRTAWSAKELKAYRAIDEQTIIDGIEDLNAYYSAPSKLAPYKRREIITLLNNWSGDMDKWADWSPATAAAELKRSGGGNRCSVSGY